MAEVRSPVERPLSPHLMIYRPMLTMMSSILHRITGAALYVGTLLLVAWLVAAATSPAWFDLVNWAFGTWPGQIVLVGYTWALFQHMAGGIRHFIWDFGRGFGPVEREVLTYASFAFSGALTAAVWAAAYLLR